MIISTICNLAILLTIIIKELVNDIINDNMLNRDN